MKKLIALSLALVLITWIAFRIFVILSENSRVVFNPVRAATSDGIAVNTMVVNKKTDFLRVPVYVKNNRAVISCSRIGKFAVGQSVGAGRITNVSTEIDLYTGMCGIKTRDTKNGENFVLLEYTGYFVPAYAVKNNTVFVVENKIAKSRNVAVTSMDGESAVINDGLNDGDIIILSTVHDGVQISGVK